jgi:DNA-binding NtrC family response regulator
MATGKSILVVDDEAAVLFTYKLLLERNGYEPTPVVSAEQAKNALAGRPFDLMLCDLSLEEKDSGFKVIEFARERHPGMPSILITGYASADAAQKAADLGVPVLYKPIDIQELMTTIPALLMRDTNEEAKTGTC